jgi:hypothetical protein
MVAIEELGLITFDNQPLDPRELGFKDQKIGLAKVDGVNIEIDPRIFGRGAKSEGLRVVFLKIGPRFRASMKKGRRRGA